jgi:hypothetical protein
VRPDRGVIHQVLAAAPIVLALAVIVSGGVVVARNAAKAVRWPAIGDIVEFPSGAQRPKAPVVQAAVTATRLSGRGMGAADTGRTCLLDTTWLRRTGGSLLVVAREPDGGPVQVRWAGGPTHGAADCGPEDDLRMSRGDFTVFRNLAVLGMPSMPDPVVP